MKKNLKDYVKIYNIMDRKFCADTIQQLKAVKFSEHQLRNVKTGEISIDPTLASTYYGTIPNINFIMDYVHDALSRYVISDLNFKWFDGWVGYSAPIFNYYGIGQHLNTHCDHIHNLFDGNKKGIPHLSVVGILNDDYEGGNFIMFEDDVIDVSVGDIIIFPSIFLFPHSIEKITKGERYSFASWCW